MVTDKDRSGEDFEEFFHEDLELLLVRPAGKDEKKTVTVPNWLRQRVEATIDRLRSLTPLPPAPTIRSTI